MIIVAKEKSPMQRLKEICFKCFIVMLFLLACGLIGFSTNMLTLESTLLETIIILGVGLFLVYIAGSFTLPIIKE